MTGGNDILKAVLEKNMEKELSDALDVFPHQPLKYKE